MPDAITARFSPNTLRRIWFIYWVALFAVMHTPREHLPQTSVSNLDKAVHFTGYLLLTLLAGLYVLRVHRAPARRWYVSWVLMIAVYAAFDELTQPFVNRTAGWADWATDIIGTVVGLILVRIDSR